MIATPEVRSLSRAALATTRGSIRYSRSSAVVDVCLIAGAWLLLAVLVNPSGEFPLNDDWSYSRSVQILVTQGRLDLAAAAVPLITQVGWGALFSVPLGFSFTALRISTWVMGFIGLVASYGLLRSSGAARVLAVFASLLLAVNPLYLSLSLSFMTDVPFVALATAAVAMLAHGLRTGRAAWIGRGLALVLLAALIRQPAIAVPLALGVAVASMRPLSPKTVLLACTPSLATGVLLEGYQVVMRRTSGLPALYNNPYDSILLAGSGSLQDVVAALISRVSAQIVYAGLFLLPLVLLTVGEASTSAGARPRIRTLVGICFALAFLLVGTLIRGRLLPLGNIIYDLGVGPPLLRDVYNLGLARLPTAPQALWLVLTIGGLIGGALLLVRAAPLPLRAARSATSSADKLAFGPSGSRPNVFKQTASGATAENRRRHTGPGRRLISRGHAAALLPLTAAGVYVVFLAISGYLDRYVLWLLPLLMACVPRAPLPIRKYPRVWLAAAGLLVAYGVFSVAGIHDYFAWNRARWQAIDYLMADVHATPAQIDGGYEFNGWYDYDSHYRVQADRSWWWVQDDQYIVAFGDLPGYARILRVAYDRWLPPGQGDIVVLERESPA